MTATLNLTEDHLKLVSFLDFDNSSDDVLTIDKKVMLTLKSHLLDDVATILGMNDKVIPGTSEDADGGAYPDDVEKYLLDTYNYVSENLYLIETLVHQSVMIGIQPGTYKANTKDMIWRKVEE